MDENYVQFTKEMKGTHKILVPNMLPMHFKIMSRIFRQYGYDLEVLETTGPEIAETGLKYVHNDTCYPAILVIGQFINALQSGKYDVSKTALMLFQTGGGCRASNYISLLRKALKTAGYGYVPVLSLNLLGMEKHPGFKLKLSMLVKFVYAVLYGDLLMLLSNQCKPYEKIEGQTEKTADFWTNKLTDEMNEGKGLTNKQARNNYKLIIDDFLKIERNRVKKVKVGIVGEIFVKYSPLGNNNLADFLISQNAEIVTPGLLDFCMYCVKNSIVDNKLYKLDKKGVAFSKIAFPFLKKRQEELINAVNASKVFCPPTRFEHTISLVEDYIGLGTKMGEGWLLPAEMLELIDSGVKNIICTQPFGCLPNHICGKGMMKPIKERNKNVNIVAIDYDAGASRVNQENRIKLMLSNAGDSLSS